MANILTPRNKIRANVQAVTTTPGGGANGHFTLACNAQTFDNIPGMQKYIHPVLLTLTVPQGTA
eukprot:2681851-Ditylum_brightwellii.AAC.1